MITPNFIDYLPEASRKYIDGLFSGENLQIILKSSRQTKLGDYRPPQKKPYHRISINADLNPYLFLMITVHEFAHLVVWKKYGRKVTAHGIEWKNIFSELMAPLLHEEVFPSELLPLLNKYFLNPRASVMGAPLLFHALKSIGRPSQEIILLKDIQNDIWFTTPDTKLYQRIGIKKRRILCKQQKNGKLYLIHPYCEVVPIQK